MTSGSHRSRHRRRAAVALATTAVAGASFFGTMPAAYAAADSFVVTNLNLDGAGSLKQAIIDANASANAEGVQITFDAALAGTGNIELSGSSNAMVTDALNHGEQTQGGAWFKIDATVPVSIDFTNLDGIESHDEPYAGIYVHSDNVTLQHLANIRVGEAGIAVDGTGTRLSDVQMKDSNTVYQETGLLLMDGATNTYAENMVIHSAYWGSVVVDTDATVTDTVLNNTVSRGVENWGHYVLEDRATVVNFDTDGSTLGALDETSPSHAFFINPNVTTTGLSFDYSSFQSPGKEGLHFYGSGQNLTRTSIAQSTFIGTEEKNLGRVISDNSAVFTDLDFVNNQISFAGGTVLTGTVTDAIFAGNSFTNVQDGSAAALQLNNATDVSVENNTFDLNRTLDHVRVEGAAATRVNISDNEFTRLNAGPSRSAVRIAAEGAENNVNGNLFSQNNSDAGTRADSWNHTAVWVDANAGARDADTGWAITNNSIDGFGYDRLNNREGGATAPIVHDGLGKLPVLGNTFGEHTRGNTSADVEHLGNWFFWNANDASTNNAVQTFRAEDVNFDATADAVSFRAVQPENEPANNTATAPVALHVYWTPANHAEVYLGSIADVAPGQAVSIGAQGHTDGFIRLQTVDANGYTSQYSAIDPDAPTSVPTAPEVKVIDKETVSGTGVADATFTIVDADGKVIDSGVVAADGTWSANPGKLACGTAYSVTQTVNGVESKPTAFKTLACKTDGGNTGGENDNTGGAGSTGDKGHGAAGDAHLAATGDDSFLGYALAGTTLVLLSGGALLAARRRAAAKA